MLPRSRPHVKVLEPLPITLTWRGLLYFLARCQFQQKEPRPEQLLLCILDEIGHTTGQHGAAAGYQK